MITINDRSYHFRFSYKAIKSFLAESGGSLSDLSNEQFMLLNLPSLLFHGIASGQKFADAEMDLTVEQIEDWIDEDMSNVQKAFEAINNENPQSEGE